ncbi:hypothetical protein [Desulfallas thermosapovorans]|uniref:Uncharacterized protein n=1 Tax=Desulfallas thermosapovorans DSM 6562 TaxID=1121431 RepID=A0A5S5A0I1_9FIRM|nr:hypothetical protein [Desulfallas thermosapovorans]TYO98000.1 hypothetical protein LX24_00284 [Desulfallas thermosapovorans DSM 6562]
MENKEKSTDARYLLAALIEIYRGNVVYLPEFDPQMERDLLRDVFSSAISFARFDESRQTISNEIFKCVNEGATVKEQMELAKDQTPDVLNAKMVAAAHVLKIMDDSKIMLS